MANDNKSNSKANEAEVLIAAAMNNEHAQQNRQAKLTLYMFANEVSYSIDELTKLFKSTDRTDIISTMLTRVSEQYAQTLADVNTLMQKRKDNKAAFTEREALQLESLNGRLRAANILFTRAATAVLHLRKVNAVKVSVQSNGSLKWFQPATDDDGKPLGDGIVMPVNLSGNSLVRAGQKHVNDLKPTAKRKAAGTASNPAKVGIAPITSAVRDRVKQVRNQPNAAGYEGMSEEEVKGLNELLNELLIAKFGDKSGRLDRETLLDYIEEEFPQPKPQSKASSNGNAKAA